MTVIGLGRYIPRIQRIAAQVDLNIIVATGVYTFNDLPPYFRFRKSGIRVSRFRYPCGNVFEEISAKGLRTRA